jgi:putative ABC transport system ATP-binding protein
MLTVENLSFKTKDKVILSKLNVKVLDGEFVTIAGASGSGKSTLLKLIANLICPTEGKIIYNGIDIKTVDIPRYRQEVSYCFQQPTLFGETVLDNLEFPFLVRKEKFSDTRVRALLTLVDLDEAYLEKPITELSGGERQRVALIRNLVFPPKILLLDEVTTGLDETSKQIVHQFIADVHAQGITILQVTHDREEIEQAEKVLRIEKGGIVDESRDI